MTHDEIIVEAFLDALRARADFRARKVRRMRAAIRSGAYENQLKLEIAADRMAADLMAMTKALRQEGRRRQWRTQR